MKLRFLLITQLSLNTTMSVAVHSSHQAAFQGVGRTALLVAASVRTKPPSRKKADHTDLLATLLFIIVSIVYSNGLFESGYFTIRTQKLTGGGSGEEVKIVLNLIAMISNVYGRFFSL